VGVLNPCCVITAEPQRATAAAVGTSKSRGLTKTHVRDPRGPRHRTVLCWPQNHWIRLKKQRLGPPRWWLGWWVTWRLGEARVAGLG
jgi:hypothetical protein